MRTIVRHAHEHWDGSGYPDGLVGPQIPLGARIVLAVASVAMASPAFFSDVNLSSGEREDRSDRWIFIPLLVIGLLSAYLPAYTDRKGWWVLDGDTVRWVGYSFI